MLSSKIAFVMTMLSLSLPSFATDILIPIPGKAFFMAGSLGIAQEMKPDEENSVFANIGIFTRSGIYNPNHPTGMKEVSEVYMDEHPYFQSLFSSSRTDIKTNSVKTRNQTSLFEDHRIRSFGLAQTYLEIKCVGKTPVITSDSFVDSVLEIDGASFRASGTPNEVFVHVDDSTQYKITFNYQKKEVNGSHAKVVHNGIMIEVDDSQYDEKYTKIISHSKAEAFCN